jgi:nucleotide-binding universal stress UspA family protein
VAAFPVLVCVDGSEQSLAGVQGGMQVVAADATPILVTVMDEPDPTLVTGTGFAGGVVTPEEFERHDIAELNAAKAVIDAARAPLNLETAESHVLRGDAGSAIVRYAEEVGAGAIVVGTRGRSGLRRAVLGSVSDYVVRHAPCPVIVTGARD